MGTQPPVTEPGHPDQADAAAAQHEPLWRRGPRRVARRARVFGGGLSLIGLLFALAFFCASLTPSLIPRVWLYQAVVSGLSTCAGYGVGTLVVWGVRSLGFPTTPSVRVARVSRIVLAVLAAIAVPSFVIAGAHWQNAIRALFGVEESAPWLGALQAVVAVLLASTLLLAARGVRWLVRLAARVLGRFVPVPTARLVATIAVVFLLIRFADGTVVRFANDRFNDIYAQVDTTTPDGVVQPTQPERSGSPASTSSWDSLGKQGRQFVASGPTAAQITDFTTARGSSTAPEEPIRVYAGMRAADSLDGVASLVVDELDRTDAWSREVLVVATSTGTGWLDPSALSALELMHAGNTAVASMQYSYLPSWVSFLSDRATPAEAGKALFEAVYSAWSQRPEDSRPQLVLFGLSLGSYGSQEAFSGLQDVQERAQGAVWAGTPNFTTMWTDLTAIRDPGSLERAPVFEKGRHVRWGTASGTAADLAEPSDPWLEPRIVYLQHASDPIVWWSPDLILQKPDWLGEQRGTDVLDEMQWFPVVTFLQLTSDLLNAGNAPFGHGHEYQGEYAQAWAEVTPVDGWTDQDTADLRQAVAELVPEVAE
ncbi:MAG: alpha/beta hydrolase [Cellulomonadaceae bacterium]